MESTAPLSWSSSAKKLPNSVNAQLLGTFPTIVEDGTKTCAFFVRATEVELSNHQKRGPITCFARPQLVKTPQGPLIVVYCMVSSVGSEKGRFISETALFPRLSSLPLHREIAELLPSRSRVYYVMCDEAGECIFNSKARVLDEWRSELAEGARAFGEGKQITDEKSAIMSLYWYQERYNPTDKIFQVRQ